jgi:hypothetical protein
MATKSAGRVSIRVLPDSTGFKKDLEKSLERIERTVRAKIPVELELRREDLLRLKRQIESLVIKIKPEIDLSVDADEIEAMKAKIEKAKPKVDVGLNTIIASRRIEALTRTRTLTIVPILAKFNGFGKHIKGIAGLNVVQDMFEEGIHFFQNIDRNAVSLGKMYTKIAGITSLLGSAAGSALSLSGSLASVGNLALFAPGFVTALGIGVGVLISALRDLPYFLQDLGPSFKKMREMISITFWDQAAQPIRDLTNGLLPTLNEQLKVTAEGMGGLFAELADSIAAEATPKRVKAMFKEMNKAIFTTRGAIRPFIAAFTTLGEVSSKYFDRFAKWTVKLSNQFNNFIQKSAKNGDLDRWMENSITNAKALGNTMRGVVRIFASLNRAAVAAGAINLTQLGESLNTAADVMNSPRFQRVATTIFRGMNDAVSGIARGLYALGPAIESAAPSIERIFGSVGGIFESLGHLLANIIDNPKFQAGAEKFFQGIESGVRKLAPAMKPFADSLGGALKLLGRMFDGVMEIVAAITIVLGPELDKIGDEFDKLIDPLHSTMLHVIEVLKPIITQFRTDVITPVVTFINEQALPAFNKIIDEVAPSIKVVLAEVKKFIDEDLTDAFKSLNSELDNSKGKGQEVADSLKDLFNGPTPGSDDFFKKLMPGFNGSWLTPDGLKNGNFWKDWENLLRPLDDWSKNTAVPWIKEQFMNVMRGVESWIETDFKPWAKKAGEDLWNAFLELIFGKKAGANPGHESAGDPKFSFWDSVTLLIKTGYETWKAGLRGWLQDINPVQDMLDALFGPSAKSTKGTGGMGVGSKSVPARIGPEIFNAESEKTFLQTIIDGAAATLGGAGAKFDAAIALWTANTKVTWDTFWTGFSAAPGGSVQTTTTTVATGTVSMGASIAAFIAAHAPSWASNWETMKTNVVNSMTDSNKTTSEKAISMGVSIAAFIASTKSTWGPAWATFQATVTTAWAVITGNTRQGVTNSASEAGQLPQRSKNAVGDTQWTLYSSGLALVSGFASGMKKNLNLVEQAAIAVTAAVAKYMPHSPAPFGPLSGKGYTSWSGRALVKDFAGGMMDNMSMVRDATEKVTGAVALGANMDLTTDLGADGIVIDRREISVVTYNPVAEPTSRTIEKASNKLRMAKAI